MIESSVDVSLFLAGSGDYLRKLVHWIFWAPSQVRGFWNTEKVILILVNLVPVVGVAFFDWDAFTILLLYCIANIVGVFFALARSLRTDIGPMPRSAAVISSATFFAAFVLMQAGLLAIIGSATNVEKSLRSIATFSGLVSIILFAGNQISDDRGCLASQYLG